MTVNSSINLFGRFMTLGGGGAISHAPGCFASQQSVIELASAACGPIEVGDVIVSMAAFSYCGLSRK